MLDAAKHPSYKGCKKDHLPLSAATKLMGIKTDYNLSEDCVDAITDFVKDLLPEDNLAEIGSWSWFTVSSDRCVH